MGNDVVIREATRSDSAEIFQLLRVFTASFTPSEDQFEKTLPILLDDPAAFLNVALINQRIIGYCLAFDHHTFYADGRVTWVEEITVAEEHRRKGIATALMKAAEDWAVQRDSRLVALATRRAEDFYKSIGYDKSAIYFRKLFRSQ